MVETGGKTTGPALNKANDGYTLSFNVQGYGGRAAYKVDDRFLADLLKALSQWQIEFLAKTTYGPDDG